MRFFKKTRATTKPSLLHLQIEGFNVEIRFKSMRNMYIRLKPGHKTVFVSAPLRTSQRAIREFVSSKTGWLDEHFHELSEKPDRNLAPRFEDNEIHFIWGQPLRLSFFSPHKGNHDCHFDDTKLYMPRPRANTDFQNACLKKLRLLHRCELERHIEKILPDWEHQTKTQVDRMSYQTMRSRWGTCHVAKRHIRLNTDLARHLPELAEYVLVHELVHFYEHGHNKRFYGFMDKFLPDWKARRKQLNRGLQIPAADVERNTQSQSEPCDVDRFKRTETASPYIQLDMPF